MLDNNFGINLSSEEKDFMNQYCQLMIEYGWSTFFPLSDEEKIEQYSELLKVFNKLTPDEITKFNLFTNQVQTLHFADSLEKTGKSR